MAGSAGSKYGIIGDQVPVRNSLKIKPIKHVVKNLSKGDVFRTKTIVTVQRKGEIVKSESGEQVGDLRFIKRFDDNYAQCELALMPGNVFVFVPLEAKYE